MSTSFIGQIKDEILSLPHRSKVQQYAADVFLTAANGSIKKGYQVDFVFDHIDSARAFADMLAAYDILPKLTNRNGNVIVYIKSKECVCNLLALIGANKSLMELNNEIALRELRNSANRRANCDTHNIGRTVEAASEQIEKINQIDINSLDDKLREVAEARIKYPDASYDELARILNLTKSGVVNRLRRLLDY